MAPNLFSDVSRCIWYEVACLVVAPNENMFVTPTTTYDHNPSQLINVKTVHQNSHLEKKPQAIFLLVYTEKYNF